MLASLTPAVNFSTDAINKTLPAISSQREVEKLRRIIREKEDPRPPK